ncbi:Sialin [Portunus trituberculatus]|uniref:Sialin n=1 Tax=Portunus trituberculatus TaxID=210409 RepID=A0A5B7F539_PORTR|nr:Sialin [Portunus trituberculatus]
MLQLDEEEKGITIPAMNTILASWFLPTERIKYTALIMSGMNYSRVKTCHTSGSQVMGKYYHPKYWTFACLDQPEDHPGVSPELLSRLQENQHSVKQREVVQIPWKSLASSLPLWGVVLAGLGNDYGFYTFLADLPTYLNDVHHLHITSIGLLSALPFLLMLLWSLAWGALMHTLSKRNFVSLVTVRRMSMAVAMYGPVVGLMVLMFMQYNMAVTVSMTCLVVMLNGAASSGYLSSLQDLAPNLAGTLMGLTNTVGSLAGIGSPALTEFTCVTMGVVVAITSKFLPSITIWLIEGRLNLSASSNDICVSKFLLLNNCDMLCYRQNNQ